MFGPISAPKTLALLLLLAPLSGPAMAEPASVVNWDDLVSPADTAVEETARSLQKTLRTLDDTQRANYQLVAHELLARDKLTQGVLEDELSLKEQQLLDDPATAKFPEAAKFWADVKATRAQLDAQRSQTNTAVDGQRIRLAGYVLPLEFDGDEVSEFLLVPYVGACIHTPPPPANQMVFVKPDRPFENEALYSPVWVEGTIAATAGTHDLSFVDGEAPVDTGYSIGGAKIEAYEQR